jgi:large subunit ribosomal protein L20
MPRAKSGPPGARRHRKVLEKAKGYRGARGNTYRSALRAVIKGLQHAYKGRKLKKREYRGLWIVRIGAAARQNGLSYSAFMHGLKAANVELNRKVLADLAVRDEAAFRELAETAKGALAPKA